MNMKYFVLGFLMLGVLNAGLSVSFNSTSNTLTVTEINPATQTLCYSCNVLIQSNTLTITNVSSNNIMTDLLTSTSKITAPSNNQATHKAVSVLNGQSQFTLNNLTVTPPPIVSNIISLTPNANVQFNAYEIIPNVTFSYSLAAIPQHNQVVTLGYNGVYHETTTNVTVKDPPNNQPQRITTNVINGEQPFVLNNVTIVPPIAVSNSVSLMANAFLQANVVSPIPNVTFSWTLAGIPQANSVVSLGYNGFYHEPITNTVINAPPFKYWSSNTVIYAPLNSNVIISNSSLGFSEDIITPSINSIFQNKTYLLVLINGLAGIGCSPGGIITYLDSQNKTVKVCTHFTNQSLDDPILMDLNLSITTNGNVLQGIGQAWANSYSQSNSSARNYKGLYTSAQSSIQTLKNQNANLTYIISNGSQVAQSVVYIVAVALFVVAGLIMWREHSKRQDQERLRKRI